MQQSALEQIFSNTFSEYGDAIFRFCLVKVSNLELAEDMTQEVFMRYWQYLRDDKEMTNTRSFLYTIANNMAKDWYKRKKSQSLDARIEQGQMLVDRGLTPEQLAVYQEVLTTIDGMEEADQAVLLLTYVEGLAPKDIADVIGENANTVSVRLHHATKRLQQKLNL